jgi:serine/threonine protein kinase
MKLAKMSAAPLPGMLVHEDVRLLRPLCAGGMGSVWAAEHRKLLTEVAVKLMASNLVDDAVARARFEREATSASRVRSPHVVQILDHGVSPQGHPFIVMELLDGRDLRAHLRNVGAMPASAALSIAKQLCHALNKAHARGIVHRDLKPSNVFLCESPQETLVKLLDFGIAKETGINGALSTTGAVGTPFYMSPEQLTGEDEVDHRADIWALGVLVFEMLTGKRPFEGTTAGALALAIHKDRLPSARAIDLSLPVALDEWFARACARNPAGRFHSAAEAARALELALDLGSNVAEPIEPPPRSGGRTLTDAGVARPPSRRFLRPLAAGGAALTLVTATLLALSTSSQGMLATTSSLTPTRPGAVSTSILSTLSAPITPSAPMLEPPVEPPKPKEPEVPAAIRSSLPAHSGPLFHRPLRSSPATSAAVTPLAPSATVTQPPAPRAAVEEPSRLTIPGDRK